MLAFARGESAHATLADAALLAIMSRRISVEPPIAMVAAARPIAMLRIMILTYSTSEQPSRSLVELSSFSCSGAA
jgi:hypothetical protein